MAVERPWWAAPLRRLRPRLRRLLLTRRRLAEPGLYDLLHRCLSPAQRREFEHERAFTVRGGISGRVYRIGYGLTVNIEVLAASGEVDHRLCAGPTGLPVPAVMLAQKLMLEAQEMEFLRIAVRHPAALGGRGWSGPALPGA